MAAAGQRVGELTIGFLDRDLIEVVLAPENETLFNGLTSMTKTSRQRQVENDTRVTGIVRQS